MNIESVQIATNRNAAAGASAINLYNTGAAENLTIGQLVSAVCLRAGSIHEAQSVTKMNRMAEHSRDIEMLSGNLQNAVNPPAGWDWSAAVREMEENFGLIGFPDNLNSYENRVLAASIMQGKLEELTRLAEEDMIELQTCVNRRDVAYTTASSVVGSMGDTKVSTANNI